MFKKSFIVFFVILLMFSVTVFSNEHISYHKLGIFGTTDTHQYIMPYDYMGDIPNELIGVSKLYTLIEEAREEYENSLLLCVGDVIQGSLVGDYEAEVNPLKGLEFQAIIRAYNVMGYDAVAVGNHEITDFGLEFFEIARKNSIFPWVSSNLKLVNAPTEFYVDPYVILERHIDGIPIKIAILGFTPPHVTDWGRRHLYGKIYTKDIVEQAEIFVPLLREKADLVIALAHTGISTSPKDSYDARGDAGYYLAQVKGIDAILLGHQHAHFPGDFENVPGIDNYKGTIHGVPAILPGSWGSHLGIIDLDLSYNKNTGEWKVVEANSHLRAVKQETISNPKIEDVVKERHEQTIQYVRQPIGKTNTEITSYFSRIMDNPVTKLINDAQIWWAEREFAGSEYENIPILSAAAPFIAGRQGPGYFTYVYEDITIGSVTDIYIYPNTVYVSKLNGKQILDWLERAAYNFKQVDPNSSSPQHILDYDFRAYNFDVIEGIEYVYDITKPAGQRVVKATFNEENLDENMEFLIVTNNYRGSGGGGFPHVANNIILETTEINREVIIRYIQRLGEVNPEPSFNWHIKEVQTKAPLLIRTAPETKEYIERNIIKGLNFKEIDASGWGIIEINLFELNEYIEKEKYNLSLK